jgi:hypothetical protein
MKENSETQTILIQVVQKLDSLVDTVEDIKKDMKTFPVLQDNVIKHAEHHKSHYKEIGDLKNDMNKAKGYALGIGGIAGFLGSLFRH